MIDRPFLISPPFGNYFYHHRAYSVLGSYTVLERSARTEGTGRWRQILRTVRPVPGGWINKIGLRNPGIDKIDPITPNQIISLAPLADRDWHAFERWVDTKAGPGVKVEFNISCPNVDEHPMLPQMTQLRRMLVNCPDVIFKLPPLTGVLVTALGLIEAGARHIHLSNTLPSPIGGISGAALREVNLPLVEQVARYVNTPERVEIIAGGGIYSIDDLKLYRDAGATRFSMSTAWFNPLRALKVIRAYDSLYGRS